MAGIIDKTSTRYQVGLTAFMAIFILSLEIAEELPHARIWNLYVFYYGLVGMVVSSCFICGIFDFFVIKCSGKKEHKLGKYSTVLSLVVHLGSLMYLMSWFLLFK